MYTYLQFRFKGKVIREVIPSDMRGLEKFSVPNGMNVVDLTAYPVVMISADKFMARNHDGEKIARFDGSRCILFVRHTFGSELIVPEGVNTRKAVFFKSEEFVEEERRLENLTNSRKLAGEVNTLSDGTWKAYPSQYNESVPAVEISPVEEDFHTSGTGSRFMSVYVQDISQVQAALESVEMLWRFTRNIAAQISFGFGVNRPELVFTEKEVKGSANSLRISFYVNGLYEDCVSVPSVALEPLRYLQGLKGWN